MKAIYLLALLSALFFNACDIFESEHIQRGAVANSEDNITYKKSVTLGEKNITAAIEIKEGLEYLKVLDGLDSQNFALVGTKVKLNIENTDTNSSDQNISSIYKVKLYGVNSDSSDFIMLLQVTVLNSANTSSSNRDSNSTSSGDNNNTGNGSDNNGTNGGDDNSTTSGNSNGNGDNNSTGGGDNNNSNGNGDNNSTSGGNGSDNNGTNGGDDNSTTSSNGNGDNNSTNGNGDNNNSSDNNSTGGGDNNSTSGGDNNNSGNGSDNNSTGNGDNNSTNGGSDNNSTGGGGDNNGTLNTDSDNDYIPDNIERLLNKDSNNDDENNNSIKDGLEGDALFDKQWYIHATGSPTNPSEVVSIEGNDLNLLSVYSQYMGYNRGDPIILQIVDSGVDIEHEDLKANIDMNRSLNGAQQGNPEPGGFFLPHGTMLAGIAAARAFNGVGVRGVAPFAKIAGSNWLVQQSLDGLDAAWLSGAGANKIAVSNNSWGTYYTIDTFYEDIMQEGTATLRDGKGRVYIFASGNAREEHADSNIQYVINNRFALVVSALNYQNKVAAYSTPGANVWVSAYGGDADYDEGPTIATTYPSGSATQTWDEDTKHNYTYAMAGSSAAAPMVSGSVALILEACPQLGWRDVKYVIAKTAKIVDSNNSNWITNSANMHFSRDYGFGLIDTEAAIKMCQNNYSNLLSQKRADVTFKAYLNIKSTTRVELNVTKDIKAEWVEATVDIDTQNASNLDIYLSSPSGTKVQLVKSGTMVDQFHIPDANWMNGGFRFSTGAFLDEATAGKWILSVENSTQSTTALLKSINIKIYGH